MECPIHPIVREDAMKRILYVFPAIILLLGLSVLITLPTHAVQRALQITATPFGTGFAPPVNEANPDVVITEPLLVSELHGQFDIHGTANLPNMRSYFLEIRGLNA